ncbi:MAG TPA: HIT domain-containing protein [Anaerolineales bacterium]|nr:HIT domain-containing protein [Anaerolineales bacterium]
MPASRVRETQNVVAYHHPEPSYPFHVLIVPKRNLESIMGLEDTDGSMLAEIIGVVKSLVEEFQLDEVGYRLIVNGGRYQHVPQLHFHLIAETYTGKQS